MRIYLKHIKPDIYLEILGDEKNPTYEISEEEALENGESKFQLVEGCSYEYQFNTNSIRFKENSNSNKIISFSRFDKHKGSIIPNIYVGTHSFELDGIEEKIQIEVRSIKSDYRKDYRYMLESITEKCTDLIMQIDSPISQHFETNFNKDSETLYQRFSFVKALIDSREFEESVQKIVTNPSTKWNEEIEDRDIRGIRRFNQKSLRQLSSKPNRIEINSDHYLNYKLGINSIPYKIESTRKTESIDTSENRFIKHALEEFLNFCEDCELNFKKYSSAKLEASILTNKIANLLNQTFFKEISRPTSLKLNSPVLQRKNGYREVLNAWLKFDLAAKLIWEGGDNVYKAGKKDIAILYEYWLFFTLLDVLKSVFEIEPKEITNLITFEKGKLSLNLKQGTAIPLKGIYKSKSRNLNVQFSYNRSFGGGKNYPSGGSYTTTLRPDYTLSIWPEEISNSKEAENQELITHIHFDAKYKVNNFYELISQTKNEELTEEEEEKLTKEEEEDYKSGNFKNQDLLKMHAYKDAIRRTGGAYVLYPGDGKDNPFRGFHELIPGLGAFAIKPKKDDKGKEYLEEFIKKVVSTFIDRTSQREHLAIKTHEILQNIKLDHDILEEPLPEYIDNKKLIPSETFVIIGYYKNENHLEWIKKNSLYNIRYGEKYPLSSIEIGAQYLLLYSKDEKASNLFFKLQKNNTKIYSKLELTNVLKYPTIPSQEMYLVYSLKNECEKEFNGITFSLNEIEGLGENKRPIAVSLEQLLKHKLQ
jgi:hypothetical protein